jgi:thiosulfate/3-mercaptopyruvate sulfurtransferase
VDCRFDLQNDTWGADQYHAEHIPTAVYAHLSRDMSGPKSGTNGRHPLPSIDELARSFSQLGIGPGTQVVAYDQDVGMFAGRLWWMLRYLGHDAVAVLDGGWAKWVREGRPTTAGQETRPPGGFQAKPRPELVATLGEVETLVGQPGTLLVDARSPERFEGRSETLDRAAGHIPGAANHFFRQNAAADGTMLPADALRTSFDRLLGGRQPEQTVMYCGSGVTACHNLLAMEYAGLTGARLYPGSWSEWSADPARPVETGPAKRV